MRSVRKSTNTWFKRAYYYLELSRKYGIEAAERYGQRFENQAKLERAIALVSDGTAKPTT